MIHRASKPRIYFSYLDPKGFSGQRTATELVIKGLERRHWPCFRLPQPALDRDCRAKGAKIIYLTGVLMAWMRGIRLLFAHGGWFCSNLPQTRIGMIREAVNLLFARVGIGRRRIVISLHGSLFMHWPARSLEARLFKWLLTQVGTITVLGEKQRERLLQMGVAPEQVHVVVNSCELAPLDSESLKNKVSAGDSPVVHLLYLSSLIDTKGYPEFLEALRDLGHSEGTRIEAILCGRLLEAEQNARFSSAVVAEAWIEQILTEINRSKRVSVRWVRGAIGEEKRRLFHEAEIFVLPTRYAVEAQPLVLLEAMASGCAIVSTQVGEIPTILDKSSACLLEDPSVAELVRVLGELTNSPKERERIALHAHQRFVDRYQIEQHINAWEKILDRANQAQ